tara:strand:- start:664 stop:990 length:327 start_codon:yes stop_codon:yes gene_type:complete
MTEKIFHLKSENRIDLWKRVLPDGLGVQHQSFSVTSHYTPEVKIFQSLENAEAYFKRLVIKYFVVSSVKSANTPDRDVGTCISCGLPFEINEGYVGEDVSICDTCNGN